MKPGSLGHLGRWIWLVLLIPIIIGLTRQVRAIGIASNMLIAIFLLPMWWHTAVDSRIHMSEGLGR